MNSHLQKLLFLFTAGFAALVSTHAANVEQLAGLWQAHSNFGPEVRGELRIERHDSAWRIDIAGYNKSIPFADNKNKISFSLPSDRGSFDGYSDGKTLKGHWTQPAPRQIGQRMSSPVHFQTLGDQHWVGQVVPRESEFTFFLPVTVEEDGTLTTFLRNPDRNLGVYLNAKRIELNQQQMNFVGPFFRSKDEQTLFSGIFHADDDYFSIFLTPYRGGGYNFTRVDDRQNSHFYARGATPEPYAYVPPPKTLDGWPVSTLGEQDIDLAPLREMIEKEIMPEAKSVHDFYSQGVLIARHGKLVFEEYFHGFHRNMPHDTRSASKSMASLLVGAAAHAGADIKTDTGVYASLYSKARLKKLNAKKKNMRLEHLLTMSSGFYCDDNDDDAPGNENTMQEQEGQPNWYTYTLELPMADAPGEKAIYCSANSNLMGAVLSAKTRQSVTELFANLIAAPLDIKQYYLGLQPSGEVYLGGGAQWLPRDFMKLGQVMLNGGTWNGTRIVSEQWAEKSTTRQVTVGEQEYGYQWWITEYPYKDRTVKAFFAGGNGGQIVLGIPELDLLIAFYGANYSDAASRLSQNVLIPKYILQAVNE